MVVSILIGAALVVAVALAVRHMLRRRKGGGCPCGCAHCPGCDKRDAQA